MRCGIVFFKYERAQKRRKSQLPVEKSLFWQMTEMNNPVYRGTRFLILLALVWLSFALIFSPIGYWQGNKTSQSFLHLINTPFHEAGHMFFMPLGKFMHTLGGTLGQFLMPLICFVVLLWKTRDAFGAAVCFWWFGENMLDIVAYMDDALVLTMPLLGGNTGNTSPYGFHDWEYLLTETGLIQHAHGLAKSVHIIGSILMIAALLWASLLLLQKRK